MFDKYKISVNEISINEVQENKKKNFIIDIFSNKYELAILTFSIYLVGVLYQILKLI